MFFLKKRKSEAILAKKTYDKYGIPASPICCRVKFHKTQRIQNFTIFNGF